MLYGQICIIGLAILIIPLLNRQSGYGRESQLFRAVIIAVMLDLVLETAAWMLDGVTSFDVHPVLFVINTLTILLQSVMGLLWFYYALEKLGVKLSAKKPLLHAAFAAPLLVNLLLLATNYWTHFIFFIDAQNNYVRGSLIIVCIIVAFIYPVAATVIALVASGKAENSAQRHDCYVLASFILPPIIAAVIQVLWYGTFLFLIGFSISLLIIFINIQNRQITMDFLTRINNRASLISYYERRVNNIKPGCRLYLFMMDVDSFKRINDVYGHVVGDQVLITVAEKLKGVCSGQRCFLARLGGDEFGILLECEQAEQANAFMERINASLDEFNSDSNLSNPITLSIGFAACDDKNCTIDRLIQQADKVMYTRKAQHHLLDKTRSK